MNGKVATVVVMVFIVLLLGFLPNLAHISPFNPSGYTGSNGDPYPTYYPSPTYPTATPTPYPSWTPPPETTPIPESTPTPAPDIAISWLKISAEPSYVAFDQSIFVTIESDGGDFYATLQWQGEGGLNSWVSGSEQVWIDSSTNSGTKEFIFSAEGQYRFTVSADDESAEDTVFVYVPPY
jgi:hypothetical protein